MSASRFLFWFMILLTPSFFHCILNNCPFNINIMPSCNTHAYTQLSPWQWELAVASLYSDTNKPLFECDMFTRLTIMGGWGGKCECVYVCVVWVYMFVYMCCVWVYVFVLCVWTYKFIWMCVHKGSLDSYLRKMSACVYVRHFECSWLLSFLFLFIFFLKQQMCFY